MKDYYSQFVDLALKQCLTNDYKDKEKVKMHNIASKKMIRLQTEMEAVDCVEILQKLLLHEDCRVRINAASLCLKKKILIKEAVCALENIIYTSNDATICFSAKKIVKEFFNST